MWHGVVFVTAILGCSTAFGRYIGFGPHHYVSTIPVNGDYPREGFGPYYPVSTIPVKGYHHPGGFGPHHYVSTIPVNGDYPGGFGPHHYVSTIPVNGDYPGGFGPYHPVSTIPVKNGDYPGGILPVHYPPYWTRDPNNFHVESSEEENYVRKFPHDRLKSSEAEDGNSGRIWFPYEDNAEADSTAETIQGGFGPQQILTSGELTVPAEDSDSGRIWFPYEDNAEADITGEITLGDSSSSSDLSIIVEDGDTTKGSLPEDDSSSSVSSIIIEDADIIKGSLPEVPVPVLFQDKVLTGERELLSTAGDKFKALPEKLVDRYHRRVEKLRNHVKSLHNMLHKVIETTRRSFDTDELNQFKATPRIFAVTPEVIENYYEKAHKVMSHIKSAFTNLNLFPAPEATEVYAPVESVEQQLSAPEAAEVFAPVESVEQQLIAPEATEVHAPVESVETKSIVSSNLAPETDISGILESEAQISADDAAIEGQQFDQAEDIPQTHPVINGVDDNLGDKTSEEINASVNSHDSSEQGALNTLPYNFYGESVVRPFPYQYPLPYYPPAIPNAGVLSPVGLPYYPYVNPYPYYNGYIRSPAPFNHNPIF